MLQHCPFWHRFHSANQKSQYQDYGNDYEYASYQCDPKIVRLNYESRRNSREKNAYVKAHLAPDKFRDFIRYYPSISVEKHQN
jgi:hypothetical protein